MRGEPTQPPPLDDPVCRHVRRSAKIVLGAWRGGNVRVRVIVQVPRRSGSADQGDSYGSPWRIALSPQAQERTSAQTNQPINIAVLQCTIVLVEVTLLDEFC